MLEIYAPELIGLKPEAEILKILKKRLESKRFDLSCLYCKKWKGTGTTITAPKKCPNCGAKLIGVVSKKDEIVGNLSYIPVTRGVSVGKPSQDDPYDRT